MWTFISYINIHEIIEMMTAAGDGCVHFVEDSDQSCDYVRGNKAAYDRYIVISWVRINHTQANQTMEINEYSRRYVFFIL